MGGFPRGEQNTLRRSNIEVGEGKSVSANQAVMLLIYTENPEGDPEILVKTAFDDPRNVECSESLLLSGASPHPGISDGAEGTLRGSPA
jgi:hypothetical protein